MVSEIPKKFSLKGRSREMFLHCLSLIELPTAVAAVSVGGLGLQVRGSQV